MGVDAMRTAPQHASDKIMKKRVAELIENVASSRLPNTLPSDIK